MGGLALEDVNWGWMGGWEGGLGWVGGGLGWIMPVQLKRKGGWGKSTNASLLGRTG